MSEAFNISRITLTPPFLLHLLLLVVLLALVRGTL